MLLLSRLALGLGTRSGVRSLSIGHHQVVLILSVMLVGGVFMVLRSQSCSKGLVTLGGTSLPSFVDVIALSAHDCAVVFKPGRPFVRIL